MIMHMSKKEMEEKTLQEVMVYEMMSGLSDAKFARKVMDVVIERNDEDVHTWEYPVNDRLQYFHMEANFQSGIQSYCTTKLLYEKVYGDMSKELEKAIEEAAESIAEKKIYDYGWRKREVSA